MKNILFCIFMLHFVCNANSSKYIKAVALHHFWYAEMCLNSDDTVGNMVISLY